MKKLTLKDWIIATRPWSFPVTVLPTLVALLYKIYAHQGSEIHWQFGILAIIGAMIFQAAGNLISDFYDYKHGIDRDGNVVGTAALTSGLFRPKQFLIFGLTLITIGVLLGLFLVWKTGLTLLWIGLFGTVSALFYYRFKMHALGDLLIFLVYGPAIMLGTGFVVTGQLDLNLFLLSIPLSFITVSVLHANNTRDMQSDRTAKIRTFAMLIGVSASKIYYYLLNGLAYVAIVIMTILQILPPISVIVFGTLPIMIKNCKMMSQISEDNKLSISELDKGTAKLQLKFSLLLVLGLIMAII
jgi:1,4-dihydroxy-2-naphthoate octaprenyltransferase